jgi:hypothetical protein
MEILKHRLYYSAKYEKLTGTKIFLPHKRDILPVVFLSWPVTLDISLKLCPSLILLIMSDNSIITTFL